MKLRDLIKQELSEANNQPSEKDLVKAINSFFRGAGLKFKLSKLPPKGKLWHAGVVPVSTKDLGHFGNIFSVIKSDVSLGWDDNGTAIVLKYEWKFKNGGTNGHRIRYILPHGKSKWEAGI